MAAEAKTENVETEAKSGGESVTPEEVPAEEPKVVEKCPSCQGSGWNEDNTNNCPVCEGRGTDEK